MYTTWRMKLSCKAQLKSWIRTYQKERYQENLVLQRKACKLNTACKMQLQHITQNITVITQCCLGHVVIARACIVQILTVTTFARNVIAYLLNQRLCIYLYCVLVNYENSTPSIVEYLLLKVVHIDRYHSYYHKC